MFATLDAKIKALQAQGVDVIKLDIGSPDGPPPEFVVDALAKSAANPAKHGYAGYVGTPRLRQAMVDYYRTRFGVELQVSNEVLPLLGSKEGIANMALAWLDPGDLALVPDPGYPTYAASAAMAGGQSLLHAADRSKRLAARPGCDPGRRGGRGPADVAELSEQPDGRGRAGLIL